MIKGRDHQTKGAPAAADLLVCFPSRAHLSLMPKPICSPARSSEPNKRHHHSHHHHRHLHHHLKKSSTRGSTSTGQASPLLWAKPKSSMGSSELVSEPTSPKVTCAGQIKVRHKSTTSCKSWQSVMEEIERMHNSRRKQQQKKPGRARPSWAEALGLKKDVMNFLTCLRNIRLDFRCFGSFHSGTDITTDDEDEDEEEEEEDDEEVAGYRENRGPLRETDSGASEGSRTVFSKWFMVLQEEQNYNNDNNINGSSSSSIGFIKEDRVKRGVIGELTAAPGGDEGSGGGGPYVPPPNALLLMRCRSAPAKSWLEEEEESKDEKEEIEEQEEEERERDEEKRSKSSLSLKCLMEEEKRKTKERSSSSSSSSSLVVMRYDTDHFYKISSDIAKETWVVGGIRDPLSRSRSWKR
ncbi:nucleolar GTP-binding protein [Parasponia andersonii]|uniref:Nucleolar GTP-binding protein n=1 Tax=Parasponia andersonii TaxID=3476 RepID=A0A2P5CKJ4_PARAD|nr:nucleolar GTP-binding protein [Parasponia andersonii]